MGVGDVRSSGVEGLVWFVGKCFVLGRRVLLRFFERGVGVVCVLWVLEFCC